MSRRNIAIIAAVLITALITGAVLLIPQRKGTPTSSPSPVDTLPSKGPELPNYTGFDDLLSFGPSTDQIDSLKYAFGKYEKGAKTNIKNIVIDNGSISPVQHDRFSESTINTINFDVAIDDKKVKAKFDYYDVTAARLYLYDQKMTLLFDSGTVDLFNGVGN